MKKNVFYLPLYALFVCTMVSLTACSSDDGDEDDTQKEAVDLPIPSSIVDGVRVSSVTSDDGSTVMSVTYNSDGSIDNVVYNGIEYDFDYADTRVATSTGRKIAQVTAKYHVTGDIDWTETYNANSFQFNTDGFLISFKLTQSEKRYDSDGYSEIEDDNYKFSIVYNSAGRLERVDIDGTAVETIDYGGGDKETDSEKISNSVNYTYNGGSLQQVKVTNVDETSTFTLEYKNSLSNTYNVITPNLAGTMSMGHPLLYIFAQLGYLGNSSSLLPTEITYKDESTDDDGHKWSDTESYTISYNFWDTNNKIRSITTSRPGYNPYTYSFVWTK